MQNEVWFLKNKYKLEAKDIARILQVKLDTAKAYLVNPRSPRFRQIPLHRFSQLKKYLKETLGDKNDKQQKQF